MWYYGRRRWFNTRGERWPLSETTMTTASNARVSRTVGRTQRVCSRSRENARWREKLEKKSNKSPGREDRTVRRKVRTFYHFGREYTYTHIHTRARDSYADYGRPGGTHVRPIRCERADWRSTDFAAMHIVGGAAGTRRVGGRVREKRRAEERRRRRSAEPDDRDGARSQVDGRALHLLAK